MKKGVITNTVCIVTAIVCIALTFWGNLKNDGVLSTDAYMGVIATLIGICATIVVGFQIVSFIELQNFRKQVNEMETLRKQMEQDNEKLQEQIHTVQTGIANAYMMVLQYNNSKNRKGLEAISYCSSIICANIDNPLNSTVILAHYQRLLALVNELYPQKELQPIKRILVKLSDVQIPDNWSEYNEIMRIHYDILSILDKVSDDEPTAETEQK